MTIAAILDLDNAIETFKNKIQTLLQWEGLSEWDGKKLQEREQAIRHTALELAGQCIALLLNALSQAPLARQEANSRTQPSRGLDSQSQGKKAVRVETVGNVAVNVNIDYVLHRRSSKMTRRKNKSIKPGQRGKGGEQRIERLTYCFGRVGVQLMEQWMAQLQQAQLPVGETLRGQRVGLNVDGGRTRLRRTKQGKPTANGRRGYYGDWREPKLFTLYALDDEGKRINSIELPVTNDATFGDVEGFMTLLEMYLVKLGIVHASQVLLVADGAPWIWQRIPVLLKRLGLCAEQIIELIDFYHAAEHLRQFSELVFSHKQRAKEWFEKARSTMRHRSFGGLVQEMQDLVDAISNPRKRAEAASKLAYFRDQPQRFAYPQRKAMNLPIGSGAIESLIRQVVNLRLKGNGKFWLPENAEIILHGRCQWAAGQWNSFSRRI